MDSVYSTRVLSALYQRGHEVQAVIKPFGSTATRNKRLFMRSNYFHTLAGHALQQVNKKPTQFDPQEKDPFRIASNQGTPCYLVGRASDKKVREYIQSLQPDLICIAFFNQLLKPNILALPKLATINAHPSLLPEYRGPSPLYWMFYDAIEEGGLTVHRVDAGEDSGEILYQEKVAIPQGIRGEQYVEILADVAARLMVKAVDGLLAGELQGQAQGQPSDQRRARPKTEDLQIHFNRPAEAVFRSVRGLSLWAPLWANFGGAIYRIHDAVQIVEDKDLGADFVIHNDLISVQCLDAVIVLRGSHRERAS